MPQENENGAVSDAERIERLKVALRQCYTLAWNLQEAARETAGIFVRAQEIRDTAMNALRRDRQ